MVPPPDLARYQIGVYRTEMETSTLTVVGMTCDHCVGAVKAEVAKIEGVTAVEVDLATGQVTVRSDGPLDPGTLSAAVDEAGYEVAP